MTMDAFKAGARVVVGTDSPNAFLTHGSLTRLRARRDDAVSGAPRGDRRLPSEALGLDAGTIEAGKLADMVMVDGNPLQNISDSYRVKRVMVNGRLYGLDELLSGPTSAATR